MSATGPRHARLATARLYLICDAAPRGAPLQRVLEPALGAGVDVFQLRDKRRSGSELEAAAETARRLTRDAGALFIVNDSPALAVAAEADGVHVGQDDLSPAHAREIVGRERIVGLSTHTPAQVDAAAGVDYIGVGPVHATPTKPGRPAVGLDLVRHAAAHATVPFFAIGGIEPANVAAVVGAGASRIAVVRAVSEAEDPAAAVRALRRALEAAPGPGGAAPRQEVGVGPA